MKNSYNGIIESLEKVVIKGNYEKGRIEKGFQEEVTRFLENKGWLVHHIEDIGFKSRLLDLYINTPCGTHFFVELKKVNGYSFRLNQFEESQIRLMTRFEQLGSLYAVMIYSQKTNTFVVTNYRKLLEQSNEKGSIKLFS